MEVLRLKHSRHYLLIVVLTIFISSSNAASSVTYLEPGSHAHVLPELGSFGYAIESINIYCYQGSDRELAHLLRSVYLQINIDSDDFNYFSGSSLEEVQTAHRNHKSIFSFNFLSRSKKRTINLDPFNSTCIGILTAEEYEAALNLIHLDFIKLALLAGGIVIFFFSSKLSRNAAFYYLSGIGLGNIASVLVLVWFISRLFPKKPLMYGILASGWTLAAYIVQMVFENIQPILISYQKYVAVYLLATSCISFGVCYYKGCPTSPRSLNLIKWGLQLIGLFLIYFSSHFREATIGICVSSVVLYYFPLGIFGGLGRFWRRKFPAKRKLISKEEYEEQGRIETEKALKELREFVKSPKCSNQWKLVMNLSQPTRFASFVEGDEHLTMDETADYDNATMDLSDDESSDEFEGSLAVDENLELINKSKLENFRNGLRVSNRLQTTQVTSSTPNRPLSTRNLNSSQRKKSTYEISDDE